MNILILGNGQLGQMLGRAAIHYGHECLLVNTKTDQVMPVASHQSMSFNLQQATDWADIVSWEHEQLAPQHVDICGAKFLAPADKVLQLTDRQLEKRLCDDLGIATSSWSPFSNQSELKALLQASQHAQVIKAAQGGYDGRSQWRFKPDQGLQAVNLTEAGAQPGIVEQMIDFTCEVSIVGARNTSGETCCYDLVENIHRDGILSYTFAGLSDLPAHLQSQAEDAFKRITDALSYVGTLAIEFFVVGEGDQARLLVNEIAPRVHNSGHWSMTGSSCDQFDLHIRALTNTPFPAAINYRPTLMINVIGAAQIPTHLWSTDVDPHWYGKDPRPGRKVGHVNWLTNSRAEAMALIEREHTALQILAN